MNEDSGAPAPSRAREVLGWGFLAAVLGYCATLYKGLGAAQASAVIEWWMPTSFLLEGVTVGTWQDDANRSGILYLALPAIAGTVGVFLCTRSAFARGLAVSASFCCAIFAFYGLLAPGVWEFFHFRWSLVLLATGLALGFALCAPLFAARWIEHPVIGLVIYALVALAVAGIIRGATGTDESLFFNFAPWPAIPVVGIEIGAYTIAGFLAGSGLGVALASRGRETPFLTSVGVLCALAIPVFWFLARFSAPGAEERGASASIALLIFVSALAFACALVTQRTHDRPAALLQRGLHLGIGALMVWFPLFVGRALADGDYTTNKFVRARAISDAIGHYFEEQESYPDSLDELTSGEYLDELPQPRVGFALFHWLGLSEQSEFSYRSLGSSYVLEFVSTEWVQCAYNPPWEPQEESDEDPDAETSDYDDYDDYDEAESGGEDSWSCPDSRPELW